MSSVQSAALFLGVAAVAACAKEPRPAAQRAVLASLAREGCEGPCPVYTVTINRDGTVEYDGKAFVNVVGIRTKTLPPDGVAQVVAAFESANYFSLKDRYEGGPTDNEWVSTSFDSGGRTKRVSHYLSGDAGAPQALWDLERRIDEIVGTLEWVGTREEVDARLRAERTAAQKVVRGRVTDLRQKLQDPRPEVRRRAAYDMLGLERAHAVLGPPELKEIASVMAAALADTDGTVRQEASERLFRREGAIGAFGPEAAALVPAFTRALSDPNPVIRRQAAAALRRVGAAAAPAAAALARVALRDTDVHVRDAGFRAAAGLGPAADGAVDILAGGLRDADERVRNAAVSLLHDLGPFARRAVPSLTRALYDPSATIRRLAATTLGRIGPDAQPAAAALREALADSSPNVREAARAALEQIETVRR